MLDKKTDKEIKILREGGQKLGSILRSLGQMAKPGMTGLELDKKAEEMIREIGGKPSFKGYQGFPNALCVSINQTVVHGIPTNKPFVEGDLVGLDIGMEYKGMHTDTAITVPIGKISKEAEQLLKITKQSLEIAIAQVGPENFVSDIGKAVENFIEPYGYGIVRDLAGHGVGRDIHEDPVVPNYSTKSKIAKMFPGLVIAIEPMIILSGEHRVVIGQNRWDVNSADNSLTAHFEHTVAVTKDGPLIITNPNE